MSTIRSIQQLESLRDEWNALADAAGHALLRHEWTLSAAQTLHDPNDLAIVVRKSGGQLTAAAPLVRHAVAGVERLEFLGGHALHEPFGFLFRDGASQAELCDEVLHLRRPVILQRCAADGMNGSLVAAARSRGFVHSKPTSPSLAVPLAANGSDAIEPSGKLRYDVKRARNRAAEHGDVRVEVLAPGRSEVDALFDRFATVEASGWKARNGSALLNNPRLQAFFRSYTRLTAEAGILRMFFLHAGNTIAAAQIAVETCDRLWIVKIGYNEAMARCSPGFLLTAEAIAYAGRQGLKGYEFLGAPEDWERRWRPVARETALFVYYPWTVRGCVGASLDVAGAAWRRLMPMSNHAG